MFPYIALILVFALLSQYRYQGKYILRVPALVLLILFIGLRNEVGTDTLLKMQRKAEAIVKNILGEKI